VAAIIQTNAVVTKDLLLGPGAEGAAVQAVRSGRLKERGT